MAERIVHLTGGLTGSGVSVALGVGATARLLYWGPALPTDMDALSGLAATLPGAGLDSPGMPPLLPVAGWGYWGQPALSGRHAHGGWAPRLVVSGVAEGPGTARIAHESEDGTLATATALTLDADTGVLTSVTEVTNRAAEPYRLDWCASLCLPLPGFLDEALVFEGTYVQEFQERRMPLGAGALVRENRRGRTSHDSFPALILGPGGFGNRHGGVYGFHLGWSGNHRVLVDGLPDGTRVVQLGEMLHPGEVVLAPGETYRSPPAHAVFAPDGLDGLTARTHAHVRARILPRRLGPRPVHFNSWEAVYFNHDRAALLDLVERAARIGVERFVLDDGWFHGRNGHTAGLGDWWPDEGKYPDGLRPLAEAVQAKGMQFGLWVEPEYVNPDSDLFRAHPDWILDLPGARDPAPKRQYLLDLARPEVAEHVFARLDALLAPGYIAYLKWDMNRDAAPAASGGEPAWRRHVLALYTLLERLRAKHPHVEIETCASGGGRADWGILARTERVWPSDSNDAHDRIAIQRGFSLFFPPEVMGSHVGRERCTVTGRRNDLSFRCAVALFGAMGVEWDIRGLSDEELAELSGWIALHKRHRALLHGGRPVRLDLDGVEAAGQGVVAPDGGQALFLVARLATKVQPVHLRLPGLDPRSVYRITVPEGVPDGIAAALPRAREGLTFTGAQLAAYGLRLPLMLPDIALVLLAERTR